MDKEKLRKVIPYVIMTMAVLLTLFSFVKVQSVENQCNEHMALEFKKFEATVKEQCYLYRTPAWQDVVIDTRISNVFE